VIHANHNDEFHTAICKSHPDTYYDWKIICLFYVAIHYLKALARHRHKKLGESHLHINNNIRVGPHNPTMPLQNTAYRNYMHLFHYSQTARYDGIDDLSTFNTLMKSNYLHSLKCFQDFKKYIISSGVKLT
jgi:hypothetical protein